MSCKLSVNHFNPGNDLRLIHRHVWLCWGWRRRRGSRSSCWWCGSFCSRRCRRGRRRFGNDGSSLRSWRSPRYCSRLPSSSIDSWGSFWCR
ncbi:hypothetical protein BT69DRAFT_519646 [Atractiella rhizophila]|nr:hypothetical protein BT69DRAFT_519646 [Atractiella rhizophila]